MQNSERLISEYDDITYIFNEQMPNKLKGLYIEDTVYLNKNQTEEELYSTVAEEIGHHLTSYGDIIDQSVTDSRRQEKKARYVASRMTVSLEGLIDCYENGLILDYECAEYLEVTLVNFREAIELYKEKFGDGLHYKGYMFKFRASDSLDIYKIN